MPSKDNTRRAQCQMGTQYQDAERRASNVIIYILCGVSAALSVCSIIISIRGRRSNGRGKDEKEN